jgi:uncharacterized protein YcbK (DUF882 family)
MTEVSEAGSNPDAGPGSTERPKRLGFSRRGERAIEIAGVALCGLFAFGWTWSIANARTIETFDGAVEAPSATRSITAALTSPSPTVAYVKDAALDALLRRARGESGKLRATTALPSEVQGALSAIKEISLITLTPFTEKRSGRIGSYLIGSWPGERGAVHAPSRAPSDRYANPRGFIRVTAENQDTPVSEHFTLRDFLTKGQENVWPKYLVLEMRLVDKLELVLSDLESRGIDTRGVTVMSGFRTPSYNAGGGNTAGRAGLSRHMYGDASDIFIDNDGNGVMDDLNKDGKVDTRDARVIEEAVNRVERAKPGLIGGAGVYIACCGHGPFIHIDTRGYRARWTGSGGG